MVVFPPTQNRKKYFTLDPGSKKYYGGKLSKDFDGVLDRSGIFGEHKYELKAFNLRRQWYNPKKRI